MEEISRNQLAQDAVMLTTFAAQQRFIDPESGFARSRAGLKYDRMGGRRPAIPVLLERGFVHCTRDPIDSKGNQRSNGLLDAFAIIFAGSGGCFAVGCNIDDTSRTLTLVVASNNAIEKEKKIFVETLWSLLQKVPVVLGTSNLPQPLSKLRESPTPAEAEALSGYLELEDQILTHACSGWDEKLVKTVRKHKATLETLAQYVSSAVIEESGAGEFLESLQILSDLLAIKKERKLKPPEYSAMLVSQLMELREKFQEMKMGDIEDALFNSQNPSDARDLYRISKAFSKVCQLPDALFKIIRLARSPNATRVWSYQFKPIYLPVLNSKPLPQAADVWRQRFAAMGVKGSLPEDSDFDKKLLTAGLKVAIEQKPSLKVHAEVKILLYFVQQGLARRMINNIGVNKLCCTGCYALLGAKEDPTILVHGQHQKWYPWPFSCSLSQDFPTMEELRKTRNEILTNFLEDWGEQRRRKRSITPGTHSDSSGFSVISPLERKKPKFSRREMKEKMSEIFRNRPHAH